jgi:hypothetical protein
VKIKMLVLFFFFLFYSDVENINQLCHAKSLGEIESSYKNIDDKNKIVNTFYALKLIRFGIDKRKMLLENIPTSKKEVRSLWSFIIDGPKDSVSVLLNSLPGGWGKCLKDTTLYEEKYLENFLNFSKFLDETDTDEHMWYTLLFFEMYTKDFIEILNRRTDIKKYLLETLSKWKNYNLPGVFKLLQDNKSSFSVEDQKYLGL